MYALAKHSPSLRLALFPVSENFRPQRVGGLAPPVHSNSRVGLEVFLGPAGLPCSRQHSELSSVLVARAQGQENAGVELHGGEK